MNSLIKLKNMISEDLALRSSADILFDYINSMPEKEISIDFNSVRSITRSFAHQYMLRKNTCKKKIEELNMTDIIRKMFDVIKEPRRRTLLIDPKLIKAVSL